MSWCLCECWICCFGSIQNYPRWLHRRLWYLQCISILAQSHQLDISCFLPADVKIFAFFTGNRTQWSSQDHKRNRTPPRPCRSWRWRLSPQRRLLLRIPQVHRPTRSSWTKVFLWASNRSLWATADSPRLLWLALVALLGLRWDRPPVAVYTSINSWWPSAAIWWHRSEWPLAQVMACYLMAPSHYLEQCWSIINYRQISNI